MNFAIKLGRRSISDLKANNYGKVGRLIRRADTDRIEVGVTTIDKMIKEGQTRQLDESLFDFENFQVKQKFVDYLQPFLIPKINGYQKIIKKIVN